MTWLSFQLTREPGGLVIAERSAALSERMLLLEPTSVKLYGVDSSIAREAVTRRTA